LNNKYDKVKNTKCLKKTPTTKHTQPNSNQRNHSRCHQLNMRHN